ncbi:beta-N-acetylhexosaminidase [Nocardia crassostreae]|uniref:beta-N-acetylhexosaminidase n=1 Tax=Nocardia crassostreae TaxID=53428 RepID=UPI00147194BA|nr:beta-N-acetylhexosaminidase [Nocardia crassostreae]
MRHELLRMLGRAALSLCVLPLLPTPDAGADAVAALPVTVPSVRQFDSRPGEFVLGARPRIVASEAARGTAQRLAEDMTRTGRPIAVTSGAPGPGDLVLRIDESAPEQAESYRIDIGDAVIATACTHRGAVHATQTLLQWFSQTTRLPAGTVTDWPDYAERGLLLDVGRKFLSVDWIKQRIREMAYYRMNLLQLHLSNHYGFRLASESHPEITSAEHYSRADIAEILSYADQYGIEVVPEIGFPGHMNAILAPHPELVLHPATTSPLDALTDALLAGTAEGRIDITHPDARPLIEDLLREFLPLFPGHYFHLGGDEYISDFGRFPQLGAYARATLGPEFDAPDLVADLFNWANGIVRSYGKTARMWNDGVPHARITVDRSVVVDFWTSGSGRAPWIGNEHGPESFADAGYTLSNAAFTPTYWVTGGLAANLNSPPELLYAWDPGLFVNGTRLRPDQRARLLGSKVFVWCDDPNAKTELEMIAPVRARLPIMAQQLWRGTDTPYPDFTRRVGAVGLP